MMSAVAQTRTSLSVNDEQSRSHLCAGSVRLLVVANLITHAWPEHERSPILEFGPQFTLEAIQNVPFDAPVVRDVAGRALNHPNTDVAELLSPPDGCAGLTCMLNWGNMSPFRRAERNTLHIHLSLLPAANRMQRTAERSRVDSASRSPRRISSALSTTAQTRCGQKYSRAVEASRSAGEGIDLFLALLDRTGALMSALTGDSGIRLRLTRTGSTQVA
jgi:hypothetical protein